MISFQLRGNRLTSSRQAQQWAEWGTRRSVLRPQ